MHHKVQYVILFHHFRRFLEAANAVNIDVAPLKGAHLLTSVYPEGEDRGKLSDVDFLVRPGDFERASNLLLELGFRIRKIPNYNISKHEYGYCLDLREGQTILFELHRGLFTQKRIPIDVNGLWERSVESTFDGVRCLRLAPEDHFVHIAFHAVIHWLTTFARTLRDLELLLLRGNADLDAIVKRAEEWRMTRIVWLVFTLLDRSNPELGLGRAALQLAPPLHVQAVLNLLVPDRTGTRLDGLHHRFLAVLLWPWLFDSYGQLGRHVANHPKVYRLANQINQRF